MKRIPCPKCDEYITFDETKYKPGQTLVFVCEHCHKQFSIRLGTAKLKEKDKEAENRSQQEAAALGYIVVIENVFGYKQIFPLKEGDNLIGRKNKDSSVDIEIESSDRSMDRRHCYINVRKKKDGSIVYTLRDNDSITGTFYMNEILGPKDRVVIEDGAVITIGATSLILKCNNDDNEE